MKRKPASAPGRDQEALRNCSPEDAGLDPALYAAAITYLFDRPVPEEQQQEWYWDLGEPEFPASPLEWTRIQAVLFANAGRDLQGFDNEQVGMGLNYLMSNDISDVPFAAIDPAVPLRDAMRMMGAMPALWQRCIGPRLASLLAPIGSSAGGSLGHVCHMWFDVWPTFWHVRHVPAWKDALWTVLRQMLEVPCRAVQVAALHGIGHHGDQLDRRQDIDRALGTFMRSVEERDEELRNYAAAARTGRVL